MAEKNEKKSSLKGDDESLKDEDESLKDEDESLKDEDESLKDEDESLKDEDESMEDEDDPLKNESLEDELLKDYDESLEEDVSLEDEDELLKDYEDKLLEDDNELLKDYEDEPLEDEDELLKDYEDEDELLGDEDEMLGDEDEMLGDEDEPLGDEDEPLKDHEDTSFENEPMTKDYSSEDESLKDEDEPLKDEDEPLENREDEQLEGEEEPPKDEPLEDKDEYPKDDDESLKDEPLGDKDESPKDEDESLKELLEDKDQSPKEYEEPPKYADEPPEEDKIAQKSSERVKSDDDYRLRNVFRRPRGAEPKHPIFSSLFARHIGARAFGPKKPNWYTPLTSSQLYLFKHIMNYVEIGREGHFRFSDFVEALQDFDSGITREEVLDILENMERNEFEELDFGKFLFLLAYRDHSQDLEDSGKIDKMLSSPVVTPRQCFILSAITYCILITSPEELERYYTSNNRRKASALHYHMEFTRLLSLTEKQMEENQKKAMRYLAPIFAVTGSPYACPVPLIKSAKKSKLLSSKSAKRKKTISSPITSIKPKREFKKKVTSKTNDKTFSDMHYGRLPMPTFKIPEEIRKEIRKKCTIVHKDYITRKAYKAIDEYKDRLKKATVLYNNRSLDIILKKGFPSDEEKNEFIELYERYMPLKLEDVKNFSLWVKPSGYEVKHEGKQLHPDKLAFGSKIPRNI